MTDNVALVGIIITILWAVILGLYLRVSSQQKKLGADIEALKARLHDAADDEA
jgi:hypothetical protein